MQHCDPDVLSLIALGEPAAAQDAAHLAGCARCQDDVEHLAQVVRAIRVDVPAGPPIAPPPRVWDAVAAQTGVTVSPRVPPVVGGPGSGSIGSIGSIGSPSRSGRRVLLAVAAAALIVGAAGGSVVTRVVSGGQPSTVVAQVSLAALPLAPTAAGQAQVVNAAGGRDLVVDVSRLTALPGRFYEVWLIDPAVKKMVAVGILQGSQGRFTIPASVDLDQYPIVDISLQQPGDPRHSGQSVLRGTLPA